jgi:hypothetical protein
VLKKINVKKEMKTYWDRQLKIQILEMEKKEMQWELLEMVSSSTSTITDMPRGGGSTSDPTAQMVNKIDDIRKQIQKMEQKIWREQKMMERVECLIKTQIQEDQELLNLRVKDRARWETIQDTLWPKYHRYTHHKSVERRYNDLINRMQQKIESI